MPYTETDFAEKPLSYKITHPLPLVPESTLLRGPNLLQWSRFIETTLKSRQLYKHCTEHPLTADHPHYAAWDAEEQFILGWLSTFTLAPDFRDRFPHQKTVKGFWDQATKFCGRENDWWRIYALAAQASNLKQGSLSISDYALAHKKAWDEVDHYLPTDDPKCKTYQNMLILRIMGFLNGLNREYEAIRRRALHNKDGPPDLETLVQELQEEESHLLLHGTPTSDPAESSALLAAPAAAAGQSSALLPTPAAAARPAKTPVCTYCGKPGHWKNKCTKRLNDWRKKKEADSKAMLAQSESSPAPSTSTTALDSIQAELARLRDQVAAMQPSSTAYFGTFGRPDYTD
ncbi:uncharacterized protein LOC144700845 [Wolffia australiana]